MRKLAAGVAATAAAAAFTLAPVGPAEAATLPVGFANVTIDGLLPICINIADINVLGIQLLDLTDICIL